MKKMFFLLFVAIIFASCSTAYTPELESAVSSTDDLQAQPSVELVDAYIRENVASLNPQDEVLGGTWYVVDIEFGPDGYVKVLCEDGHIESSFGANYAFDENGDIGLTNIVEL